jgi:hypothetical protein
MASSHKLVHDALEANKAHQAVLIKYAQDLATEIEELDGFLVRCIALPLSELTNASRTILMPLKMMTH